VLKWRCSVKIPFEPEGGYRKYICPKHVREFWEQPDAIELREKQGCYVFALEAGGGFTPWYVGKTKRSFYEECFKAHKLGKYNDVLCGVQRDGTPGPPRKGLPVLFFVAPAGDVHVVPDAVCDDVETYLIHAAHEKNPDLPNYTKIKILDWTIAGVYRSHRGAASTTAQIFGKMMGLHRDPMQKQQESAIADGAKSDSGSNAAGAAQPNSTTPLPATTPAEPAAAAVKGPPGAPEPIGKPANAR
jgi:hypothetical protein